MTTIDTFNEVSFFIPCFVIFFRNGGKMLESVVIEIGDAYIEKGLIKRSDEGLFGITALGSCYGLALAIITLLVGDETKIPDDIFEEHYDDIIFGDAGNDWTVEYMGNHEFNPKIYDIAQKIMNCCLFIQKA
jgi:hypothetical protein